MSFCKSNLTVPVEAHKVVTSKIENIGTDAQAEAIFDKAVAEGKKLKVVFTNGNPANPLCFAHTQV
jgi:hypothetical protein